MGTIKRRRRLQRNTSGLTDSQRLELLHSISFADEPAFSTPDEMRRAWHRHRHELMYELGPWRRPDALFCFDLRVETMPATWDEEIAILQARGLIDRAEELAIEAERKRRQ